MVDFGRTACGGKDHRVCQPLMNLLPKGGGTGVPTVLAREGNLLGIRSQGKATRPCKSLGSSKKSVGTSLRRIHGGSREKKSSNMPEVYAE